MVCIYCGGNTAVANSRHQKRANQVWRRRKCTKCGAIFTSIEAVDATQAIRVVSDRHFEPFSRDKLLLTIYDSLKHRKTATEDSTAVTATIISHLLPQIKDATLQRTDIARTSLETLQRFDQVAATHYRAFHPV